MKKTICICGSTTKSRAAIEEEALDWSMKGCIVNTPVFDLPAGYIDANMEHLMDLHFRKIRSSDIVIFVGGPDYGSHTSRELMYAQLLKKEIIHSNRKEKPSELKDKEQLICEYLNDILPGATCYIPNLETIWKPIFVTWERFRFTIEYNLVEEFLWDKEIIRYICARTVVQYKQKIENAELEEYVKRYC